MPEHDGLMRVFWPTDLHRSDLRGVVVGWRNSALDVFVVAILEEVSVRRFPSPAKWLGWLMHGILTSSAASHGPKCFTGRYIISQCAAPRKSYI